MLSEIFKSIKEIITDCISDKTEIPDLISQPDNIVKLPNNSIPQCGIDLINSFEKCEFSAYRDQGGIWTLGWGRTKGVKEGDVCTQAQADAWRREDCAWAWEVIQRNVKVRLTSNQGGSLLSLVYNLGGPRFEKEGAGLLIMLNSGNYDGIPAKIKQFIWVRMPDGVLKVSQGLVVRRKAEAELWIGSDWRQIS